VPYKTISELPDNVKVLPEHGQEIFLKAFNSALEQYKEEPKSFATAWTAVERVFKKNGDGVWVAKEADSGLSDNNKRDALQSALMSYYGVSNDAQPKPEHVYIEDVFDTEIIYDIDGQNYRMTYTENADGVIEFGEPEKVMRKTTYEPIEALQSKYSEIIQEVGRRNASLDSGRIKKIVELCQELLSNEDIDDEKVAKVAKAVKEADSTLKWLKNQALVKVEGDIKYPMEAYAYTPDTEDSSTWKLRLWESVDKGVTKFQLGKISAMLSPGGYNGQKIVLTDSSVAKRKIRSEYQKLGVEDDDMSKWIKEVETREILNAYVPLTEAKFDKGRATVIVIKPGFNATEDRYYPAEMLKRDYKVFEGHKMYADHPTEAEDAERPERSIKDWVATLSEVAVDDNGVVTGIAEIVAPWLMLQLATLRDKGMLSEMGISINAVGSASKGQIDGKDTLIIEKLVAARSVDFVTEPGAGGIVTFYESDRCKDIDLIDISTLRETRPDLVKELESDVRTEILQEVKAKMELEEKVTELEGTITTLTTERDELLTKEAEAVKVKAKADASAIVKEAVDKAELPEAAKERILERFKDLESAEGIEEAITAEKDYIAKLTESGKVKGLGDSTPSPEKDKEALKESFKRLGMSDVEAEIAANG